jgi:protein O-GlcNAc transferase
MLASLELALAHHRSGRLDEAEKAYHQVLAVEANNLDALHFLGVLAYQRKDYARASALITQALSHNVANPAAHNNLGNVRKAQGKLDEAMRSYLEALALQPDYADALCNLASVFQARGRLDKAASCYRRALSVAPDLAAARAGLERLVEAKEKPAEAPALAEAHVDRGNALQTQGRLDEARASYARALELAPDFLAAYVNLGNVILQQGRPQEAIPYFRRALALEPEMSETLYNLGIASHRAGLHVAAKASLGKYLQLVPEDKTALTTLADTHRNLNELDAARACYERALALDPAGAEAHNGLANVFRNQARHESAVAHYELAIANDPHPLVPFQNLLFCMLCMGKYSARDVYEKHREFAERFERPLLSLQRPHENGPDPERRLRLGYVSPDLRSNVVAHYVEPILRNHDRTRFEVSCYFTGAVRDDLSGVVSSVVDRWHDAHALTDEEFAKLIRAHRIDVLVDLCGHGPGNRILALARKPAPIQVNYLDYSATTGLTSIDYRLTTEYCDPSGRSEQYYSEKLYRLPRTYWTYNPSVRLPVSPLPLKSNGYATFGSFNLYYRITAEVLEVWSRLLQSVAGARLLIVGVAPGSTQEALFDVLERAGVARERISAHDVVSYEKYNQLMSTVDIALAPFPYNGATTMLDCMWNGLPVIAREGKETFYSRMGCSLLNELGLSRLIASDGEDYVRLAASLANDLPTLETLRGTLRDKVERSAMRDFRGFTAALESAYRTMWSQWCAQR